MNAKIASVRVHLTRGMMIAWIALDLADRSSIHARGIVLHHPAHHSEVSKIHRLMTILEIEWLDEAAGKAVRVECDAAGRVTRIGHYLNDEWLEIYG